MLGAAVCLLLAGCGSGSNLAGGMRSSSANPINWIRPYKVDVIQGNFISSEQVELLKSGMTRAQVRDVLGTPLLASIFHADRWDYVFTLKRRNVEPQSFRYAVFFKGEALERFEGDTMPSEAEFIATLASGRKLGKAPVLEASEAQLDKAAEKSSATKSPSAAGAAATPPPATQPPAAYPPLESPPR